MEFEKGIDSLPPVPEMQEQQSAEEQSQQEQAQPEQIAASSQPERETSKEKNIRALRERAQRADQLERERDELLRMVREQHRAVAPTPPQEEDLEFKLDDNDLAEGKHLSKVQRKIQHLETQLIEARLKALYPDFDRVVSAENVRALSSSYPEIAATLNSSRDLYGKAVSAYTMIKKLGLTQQEDSYSRDREIAAQNAAKPRPLASVSPQQGDSPLSHANAFANGLTPELRKQLHREMVEAMKKN